MYAIKFIYNIRQSLSDPYFETYLSNTYYVYYFVDGIQDTKSALPGLTF